MTDLITRAKALLAEATPGPWDADCDEGLSGIIITDNDEIRSIAHVDGSLSDEEWVGTIRLIAAAPTLIADLVRALEAAESTAVQRWKDANGYDDLLRAYGDAIARAEAAESRAAQAEAMVAELLAALPTEDEHDAIRECTSESEYSPRVHESLGRGRDERRKVWDYLNRYALAARKARK